MRCLSCNKALNDFEATRKFAESGAFVDMCMNCCSKSEVDAINIMERVDLLDEVNSDPIIADYSEEEDAYDKDVDPYMRGDYE